MRFDAFNAFNHTQFDNVNGTLTVVGFRTDNTAGSPTFGRTILDRTPTNLANDTNRLTGFGGVTSVRPPRNLQLSARFEF